MEINRKYFKQSDTVYVFPVGFIQNNEVFDKEFIGMYDSWYTMVVNENKYRPIGIENLGGSAYSYKYYLKHEMPSTAVDINVSNVLGGL